MKKFLVYIIFLLSFVWTIGLDALVIPQKATILAMSGSGIAGDLDIDINPSSSVKPYLGFSNNTWLAGVSGQKTTWVFKSDMNHSLSFESLGINDIEYHSDNDSDPEGYVSANWFAIDYGSNMNLNKYFDSIKDLQVGYNIKLNYSKLHIENSWGYTFDLGLTKKISDSFNMGFVIKNSGKEYYSSEESITINPYVGIGISHNINIINSDNFYTDLVYHIDVIQHNDNNIFKLGVMTKFPYINLMFGSSYSDGYSDFSYGLSFEIKKWAVIFGNLNHDNPALGTPQCIEIRKYF